MAFVACIPSKILFYGYRNDCDNWIQYLDNVRTIIARPMNQHQPASCSSSNVSPNQVFCWGNGLQGQLGHGDYANQALPKSIDYLTSCLSADDAIRQCSSGSFHSGCVTDRGRLFTWGREQDNRLGHGFTRSSCDQPLPKNVATVDQYVTKVACGDAHNLALTADGRILSWGKNNHYQCGRDNVPTPSVHTSYAPISSSFFSRKASTKEPEPDPWNNRLQGIPPLPVGFVDGLPPTTHIVDVDTGKLHSIALSSDGDVYVWGSGSEGALGLGTVSDCSVPTKIDSKYFDGKKIIKIGAGFHFSTAISEDGMLYTFGSDQYGQLGHGKESRHVLTPTQVRSLSGHKIKDVSCGYYHIAAITDTGDVFTWGYGKEGQLGHSEKADHSIPTRVEMLGSGNRSVSCGGGHTAVVDKDFVLWMMGKGRDGQLGRADHIESIVADRDEPREVQFFTSSKMKVLAVSLGQEHSLAIVGK